MCVNNLPKVATKWNSGATRESNRTHRVLIPSALTTKPLSYCRCVALAFPHRCDVKSVRSENEALHTHPVRMRHVSVWWYVCMLYGVCVCFIFNPWFRTAHRHLMTLDSAPTTNFCLIKLHIWTIVNLSFACSTRQLLIITTCTLDYVLVCLFCYRLCSLYILS